MRVLFAASEATPFCKTGGLADVAGSLPIALSELGDEVAVILPLYEMITPEWRKQMTYVGNIYVDLSWRHQYCGLYSLEYRGVTWFFVDNEQYFKRERLYGYYDDGERFAFFSKAVVDLLPMMGGMPDTIHCNDWQTALVPIYLKDVSTRWEAVRPIHTVFTIHNVEYQGQFGHDTMTDVFGLDEGWWNDGTIQMDGSINLMKAAILVSDRVTTVSPTYAAQLRDPVYSHRMESVIAGLGNKMIGVLNGIDMKSYNPYTDKALPYRYAARMMGGKAKNKVALQESVGLHVDPDIPIIAMVSRLVGHKGMDLVCRAFDDIMAIGVQVVVLGTGELVYEDFFRTQAKKYPERVAVCITYNEGLSRRIYAGSDLFLMPSRSEPCGLSQMIAMRYGCVPIVRKTGGSADSVRSCQVGQSDGTGYLFDNYDPADMTHVIGQAVGLYRGDPDGFSTVVYNGMTTDFSWNVSAKAYHEIYGE